MPLWWLTKDGDKDCLRMYERHYSAYRYRDGRKRSQFVGPGEKLVLTTFDDNEDGFALFVWRNFIDDCIAIDSKGNELGIKQEGVNCAAFRNESQHRSSDLIREACAIADTAWPNQRRYTYVDPSQLPKGSNPGYCFLAAGWQRCNYRTKSGLMVLEFLPLRSLNMANINWTELKPAERKRTYTFPTQQVTFENVTRIEVRESGKHRIETADGRKAFVSPGWLSLEIDVDEWTC